MSTGKLCQRIVKGMGRQDTGVWHVAATSDFARGRALDQACLRRNGMPRRGKPAGPIERPGKAPCYRHGPTSHRPQPGGGSRARTDACPPGRKRARRTSARRRFRKDDLLSELTHNVKVTGDRGKVRPKGADDLGRPCRPASYARGYDGRGASRYWHTLCRGHIGLRGRHSARSGLLGAVSNAAPQQTGGAY